MTKNKYKSLEKKAELWMKKAHDPMHDFGHVQRVMENANKIIVRLNLKKKVDRNILKTACLFHDIAFVRRKASFLTWIFEGKYSVRTLRELDVPSFLENKEYLIVENAIRHHSLSFPFRRLNKKRDLYCQILQDADTLDLFYEERIKSLRKSKEADGIFYKAMHAFNKPVSMFGKKHIRFFLNFPQLAKSFCEVRPYLGS